MRACLLHHGVGEPAHIQNDLGMFQRAVVPTFASQEAFDADFASTGLIRPLLPVAGDEPFAVVLMHACVDTLLGVGCGGDQVNPEAGVHGSGQIEGQGCRLIMAASDGIGRTLCVASWSGGIKRGGFRHGAAAANPCEHRQGAAVEQ